MRNGGFLSRWYESVIAWIQFEFGFEMAQDLPECLVAGGRVFDTTNNSGNFRAPTESAPIEMFNPNQSNRKGTDTTVALLPF
jgi:hypothetical protein